MSRRSRDLSLVFLFAMAVALAVAGVAFAAPGDFDTSFGDGGFAVAGVGSFHAFANSLAIQPNGRILVGGEVLSTPDSMGIAAFSPDGQPDTSFNSPYGFEQVVAGTGDTYTGRVAAQADNTVLLAGQSLSSTTPGAEVVRFHSDGSSDGGFGSSGYLASFPTSSSILIGLIAQPDGKFLLVTQSGIGLRLARYDGAAGTPDLTYGGGAGYVDVTPPSGGGWKTAALAPDGSVTLAGRQDGGTYYSFLTAHVTAAGLLDWNYGGGFGAATSSQIAGSNGLTYVTVQPDGRSVGSGTTRNSGTGQEDVSLVRNNADGSLDGSFGSGGFATLHLSTTGDSTPEGLALMPDGRIIALVRFTNTQSNRNFAVARFLPDGILDPSFGAGGVKLLAVPTSTFELNALALQADGKIVIAGDGSLPPAHLLNGMYAFRLDNSVPPAAVPAAPVYAPTAHISSPSKSKLRARAFTRISGTAGPAGQVTKVEIALRELNSKLLKKKRECLWLANSKGRFAKRHDRTKKCAPAKARWLKASGTTHWSYRLKHKLNKGRYRLFVRVTLRNGSRTSVFSSHSGTMKSFALK